MATEPRWHPRGGELFFRASGSRDNQEHIWRMPATGGNAEQLTDTGYNAGMDFSPDGESMVYQSHGGARFEVYVMSLSTGEVRRITSGDGDHVSPRWSPDGSRIAFLSGVPRSRQLQVMSAQGGATTPLTSAVDAVHSFDWRPDGKALVYSLTAGSTTLWQVDLK